jgi:hypothetical protein
MAIAASSVLPANSLEDFRIEFNNLVSDVSGITATNKFTENIIFEGATADAYETTLTVTDPTADRTVTIPNVTGTVLLGTQANPDSADGAALGSASAEWSDLYLADGGVIYFGNDQEIVLTHVPDSGIRLSDSDKMLFGDGDDLQIYHNGSNSYVVDSGTGKLHLGGDGGVNITNAAVDEDFITCITDGAVSLFYDNSAKLATASSGVTITGTATVSTAMNPASADGAALGTTAKEWSDLYLADGSVIYFGNDQDVTLTHYADNGLRLKHTATADDKPIVFVLQTGETDIAADDVLGSIRWQAPDEGTGTDAILVSAAIDAISEGDFSSSSNATKLAFRTGASETATEKMALTSGGNLQLPTDGTVLSFGADSEVTLTHVHNMGLTLNSDNHLRFGDAGTYIHQSADGVLDLVSDNEVEINGTTIDINGAVEISGTTTQTGISTSAAKDVFNAGLSVKNGSTSAGFIEFFEDSDNGTNKVTLIGPSSTSDVTITLPSSTATLATSGDITALAIALG